VKRFLTRYRGGLLAGLLLLSSLVSSLALFIPTADAASTYDGLIKTTESTEVKNKSITETVTNTTIGYMYDCDNWTSQSMYYGIDCNTFKGQFDFLLERGYGWAISNQTANTSFSIGNGNLDPGDKFVTLTYQLGSDAHGEFRTLSGDQYFMMKGSSSTCTIHLYIDNTLPSTPTGDGPFVSNTYCESGTSTYTEPVQVQDDYYLWSSKILFFNAPIDYPPDYEGDLPPDTAEMPIFKSPDFSYTVDGSGVTAQYIGPGCIQSDEDPNLCSLFNLSYGMQKDGGEYEYQVLGPKDTYKFQVPEYGHYNLTVIYVEKGVPYANLPSEFTFRSTTVEMYIDGSNTYSADTLMCGLLTDGYKNCPEVSPYEDCTDYGLDVVGGLGCVIRNFGVFLRGMLVTLFVPPQSFFSGYFEQFGQFLNDKLGFLYQSIALVFEILGSVITNAVTPKCELRPPGTLFGSEVSFNMCEFQNAFGEPIFIVIQSMIIGITVVTLIFAGIRKYQEVVDKR